MRTADVASFLTDPSRQPEVYAYLEKLKSDPDSWKRCIQAQMEQSELSNEELFFQAQVIESFLVKRYPLEYGSNPLEYESNPLEYESNQLIIRQWLMSLSARFNRRQEPIFLSKKMAHLVALVFVADFPSRWSTFFQVSFLSFRHGQERFQDLFLPIRLDQSPSLILFYLHTLSAIDSVVVDRDIQRVPSEYHDQRCNEDIVYPRHCNFMCTKTGNEWNSEIIVECLENIGRYVSWIEVELIVNDSILPVILSRLVDNEAGDAAVDALCAVLEKGMDAQKKLVIIRALTPHIRHTVSSITERCDEDEALRSVQLINTISIVLMDSYQKIEKTGEQLEYLDLLNQLGDGLLRCAQHESVSVSLAALPTCRTLMLFVRVRPVLTPLKEPLLQRLIAMLIRRYRLPNDFDHNSQGENEVEFLELRKELRHVFVSMCQMNVLEVLRAIRQFVEDGLSKWRQLAADDIELLLALSSVTMSNSEHASQVKALVIETLSSDVIECRHPAVTLAFFEVVMRFDKLITSESRLIIRLLEYFLDDRGIGHANGHVRSRVVYILCGFIRNQKLILSGHVNTVLTRLAPLLAIAPNGSTSTDSMITANDQLFLFETTATLIVWGALEREEKRRFIAELVGGLGERFASTCHQLSQLNASQDERRLIARYMANIVAYSTRTTKAFASQQTMSICGCADIYLNLMTTFLEGPLNEPMVFDAVRQYLHRMVVCLDSNQLIRYLPLVIRKCLATAAEPKALQDLLILVQQILSKYKERISDIGEEVRLVLQRVCAELRLKNHGEEEEIGVQRMYLGRSFLQVLVAALSNNVFPVIVSLGEAMMRELCDSILSLANCPDATSVKQAFLLLHKMINCDNNKESLVPFLIDSVAQVALQVPLSAHFDPNDAQWSLAQHEAAILLSGLRSRYPDNVIPLINRLPPLLASTMDNALAGLQGKELDRQLEKIYREIRSGL